MDASVTFGTVYDSTTASTATGAFSATTIYTVPVNKVALIYVSVDGSTAGSGGSGTGTFQILVAGSTKQKVAFDETNGVE